MLGSQPPEPPFSGFYPVELPRLDIGAYAAGNTGIPYVWRFSAPVSGPHVWINALTHGNEVCGAYALDALLRRRFRPLRGSLTLSFANVGAYHAQSADFPLGQRYLDEDLNRVWGRLEEPPRSREAARARALLPIAETADILLDIHAMTHPTEPLAILGLAEHRAAVERAQILAMRLGFPRLFVADSGHRAGTRLRDYGGFAAPQGERTALLIECGGWWERRSAAHAIDITQRLLYVLGLSDSAPEAAPAPPDAGRPLRLIETVETVTARTAQFAFVKRFRGDEIIERAGTVIAHDGDRPVVTPVDHCFLMFPDANPRPGLTAVRLCRVHALDARAAPRAAD
jgi:succinylglutamate desuccinylase